MRSTHNTGRVATQWKRMDTVWVTLKRLVVLQYNADGYPSNGLQKVPETVAYNTESVHIVNTVS